MKTIDCDFLVIGSGLAGLTAALKLSPHGHVVLATKKDPSLSSSDWAQGGIACVMDAGDSFEDHVRDTLDAGAGICKENVARAITEGGPERIAELEEFGVRFERSSGVGYDLGTEGGHTHRRVLHAGDITGHEVINVLLARAAEEPNITLLGHCMAIDLVTTGWLKRPGPSRCVGAYFLRNGDEIFAVRSPHTILATGGAGKVYLYTSNPDTATGDGIAMAWRAGLPVRNMEFVQFHPTCLFHREAKSFLISEAVRGEGAVLRNADGDTFAERFDPRGELAPRDIVARAIDHEIKTRGDPCVFLDITHQPEDFLKQRFPNIHAECARYGFDMSRDWIPVVPAAHYVCGGVEAGVDGRTALPGLFVVGESACTGLHGANRLASNSLLEAMVCAHECALTILEGWEDGAVEKVDIPAWRIGDAVPSDEAVVVEHNWNEVRTCMWDYVGIVRTNRRLERALRRIRNLRMEIRQYYLDYVVTSDMLELRNLAEVAELIVRSAYRRRESRGLHYILDFPDRDDENFLHDTRIIDPPGGAVWS